MGESVMLYHARDLCEVVLVTRPALRPPALKPTFFKRPAASREKGIAELEAVSDARYSSTHESPVSYCMDTILSYLPGNQLIETSSSITPHLPRKLDACNLCARVYVWLPHLIPEFRDRDCICKLPVQEARP